MLWNLAKRYPPRNNTKQDPLQHHISQNKSRHVTLVWSNNKRTRKPCLFLITICFFLTPPPKKTDQSALKRNRENWSKIMSRRDVKKFRTHFLSSQHWTLKNKRKQIAVNPTWERGQGEAGATPNTTNTTHQKGRRPKKTLERTDEFLAQPACNFLNIESWLAAKKYWLQRWWFARAPNKHKWAKNETRSFQTVHDQDGRIPGYGH